MQPRNHSPISTMSHINFEFKARSPHLFELETKLLLLNPQYIGEDWQKDTYFQVGKGRLKLREGNIENSLIYYDRINSSKARQSEVILYNHLPDQSLKDILFKVHDILVVVEKVRKIYFIENVKFHFDTIEGLGTFIEVEAIDNTGRISLEMLKNQCRHYADFFKLKKDDFIAHSYSDLIMQLPTFKVEKLSYNEIKKHV